jgi:hypothetical protein
VWHYALDWRDESVNDKLIVIEIAPFMRAPRKIAENA